MPTPPDNESLQSMLRAAASGDEIAWRTIVETYSPRVFGLLRSQCGRFDLAEEITQSTFCTIVAKIDSYTELGKFEAWLFRIAVNRLRDELRRQKRQATPVEGEVLTGLAGAGDDTATGMEGSVGDRSGSRWRSYRMPIGESCTCGTSVV